MLLEIFIPRRWTHQRAFHWAERQPWLIQSIWWVRGRTPRSFVFALELAKQKEFEFPSLVAPEGTDCEQRGNNHNNH